MNIRGILILTNEVRQTVSLFVTKNNFKFTGAEQIPPAYFEKLSGMNLNLGIESLFLHYSLDCSRILAEVWIVNAMLMKRKKSKSIQMFLFVQRHLMADY